MRKILFFVSVFVGLNCYCKLGRTFCSESYGFCINYPDNWVVHPIGYLNCEFFVREFRNDPYPIDINFDIKVTESSRLLLEEIVDYKKRIKKDDFFENSRMIALSSIFYKGFDAYYLVGMGDIDEYNLVWFSVFFKSDYKLYQLTSTCGFPEYSEYKSTIREIFDSFYFIR